MRWTKICGENAVARAFALIVIALLAVTAAQAVEIERIEQVDADGNGQLDETRIHARFATDNDLITAIDGGGDMSVSDDWRASTDFRNDLWIFDAGADGRAELIIQFRTDANNRLYANFHIDANGDSMVNFQRNGSRVEVYEHQMNFMANWDRFTRWNGQPDQQYKFFDATGMASRKARSGGC
jgi:hypothetical protein